MKCFDDVQCGKPDPASYLAALSTLQVDAKRAIAFEDSPNGILAAHRAGLFCVAIPNPLTYQLSLEHADMRLKALSDLKAQVASLEGQKAEKERDKSAIQKQIDEKNAKLQQCQADQDAVKKAKGGQ